MIRCLRGRDRDVASVLGALGLSVDVRPCLGFASEASSPARPRDPVESAETLVSLTRPLPRDGNLDLDACVTLTEAASDDEGPIEEFFSFAPFVSGEIGIESCATRRSAYADEIGRAEMFSHSGYFGNESSEQWIYSFAVLEVSDPRRPSRARDAAPAPPAKPPGPRVVHKKFGVGEVLSGDVGSPDAQLEIRFADGSVRKILARFVALAGTGNLA